MKTSNFIEEQKEDKIEVLKQQVVEIQKVFDNTIHPHKNHTLFEIDLVLNTIIEAVFDSQPEINWYDAVRGRITTKKKITKREGCVYISALNQKNAKKVLKRDFNIKLKNG